MFGFIVLGKNLPLLGEVLVEEVIAICLCCLVLVVLVFVALGGLLGVVVDELPALQVVLFVILSLNLTLIYLF